MSFVYEISGTTISVWLTVTLFVVCVAIKLWNHYSYDLVLNVELICSGYLLYVVKRAVDVGDKKLAIMTTIACLCMYAITILMALFDNFS